MPASHRGGQDCPPRNKPPPPQGAGIALTANFVLALLLAAAASGCAPSAGEQLLSPARGDWKRTGPVQTFRPENLFEYIDGQAPLVISFGFKTLRTAGYRRAAEPETTVDIYEMGSAANAFALFRSNANLDADPLDVGAEGAGAGADARIEFWKGPRYVVLNNPYADERPHVLALARELAQAMPPGEGWPAYLDLLPATGRAARSEKFLPADFLGQPFLKRTVSARYKVGGREVTIFACRCDTAEEAAQALDSWQSYLKKRRDTRPFALGDGGFLGDDPDMGRIAVFRRGPFLGGMLPYAEEAAADALMADLDKRLSGTK